MRIQPRWDFTEVRRAALALAREVERRMPGRATSKWWKEERDGVFLDYNQNARDRTSRAPTACARCADARVSCGADWDEVPDVEPPDLRIDTVPDRLANVGDPLADIDDAPRSTPLLELARRDEEQGLGDAPWPPNFAKQRGEPKRVQPSRAREEASGSAAPRRRSLQGDGVLSRVVRLSPIAARDVLVDPYPRAVPVRVGIPCASSSARSSVTPRPLPIEKPT